MNTFQFILVAGCLAFLGFMAYQNQAAVSDFFFGETKRIVQLGGVKIFVSVADTEAERVRGLSGTASLGEFEGMLFVFEAVAQHGIWMKDMNYPLDIFWIDEEGIVVHIEERVDPNTYPRTFKSTTPARYVLETNANLADSFNIRVGQQALIPDEIRSAVLSN